MAILTFCINNQAVGREIPKRFDSCIAEIPLGSIGHLKSNDKGFSDAKFHFMEKCSSGWTFQMMAHITISRKI